MEEIVESLSFKEKMLEVNFLGKRNTKKKNRKVNVMKIDAPFFQTACSPKDITACQRF